MQAPFPSALSAAFLNKAFLLSLLVVLLQRVQNQMSTTIRKNKNYQQNIISLCFSIFFFLPFLSFFATEDWKKLFQVFWITFYDTFIMHAALQQLLQISIAVGFASQSSICKSQMAQ